MPPQKKCFDNFVLGALGQAKKHQNFANCWHSTKINIRKFYNQKQNFKKTLETIQNWKKTDGIENLLYFILGARSAPK